MRGENVRGTLSLADGRGRQRAPRLTIARSDAECCVRALVRWVVDLAGGAHHRDAYEGAQPGRLHGAAAHLHLERGGSPRS